MISLILADDHAILRSGIRHLLGEQPDIRVVAEVASGDDVLTAVESHEAEVIVLDVSMPGPPFLELLGKLRERVPAAKILVFTSHAEERFGIQAIRAGAAGYLTKDRAAEELVDAIRTVHAGRRYITRALAEHMAAALDEGAAPPHTELSAREFEVFQLLIAGRTVKQMAAAMGLSSKTVSTYRTRVLQKLGAQTAADLVRYALKHKLLNNHSE
jgi:two-component system, NarL family, invasion response regulator UvrY